MKTEIYFISNAEAQDILKDRLAHVQSLLASVDMRSDIETICKAIEVIQNRIFECGNLAGEIKTKKAKEHDAQ